jgi:hypothetical protein
MALNLNDRASVIAAANRCGRAAIMGHHRAGRSTYCGDAEHVYERTAEGAVYLVEDHGRGLERIRLRNR